MNAKKIMGAVLVALLAAALFVGAGAAATNYGTVFVYQNTTIVAPSAGVVNDGVYTNGNAQVTVTNGVPYPGANFVPGTYKKGDYSAYFTYPTATYTPTATVGGIPYLVANGGNVYNNTVLTVSIGSAFAGITPSYALMTFPNGTAVNLSTTNLPAVLAAEKLNKGTYKIQAIFTADNKFVSGIPNNLLLDSTGFTYTIIGEDDATISVSAETMYAGDAFTITVKGTPGVEYKFDLKKVDIAKEQFVTLGSVYNFTMPNNGEATFQAAVNASAKDEASVGLLLANGDEIEVVDLTVSAAVITATLGASSYYVGDEITISGTSTAGIDNTYNFFIQGTNFKKTPLAGKVSFEKSGKEWEVKIDTENVKDAAGKSLDVGTYTITIEKGGAVVKTIAVALKQPFISIVSAPEVVVQETEAKFVINAEASASGVKFYVFGTNYFLDGGKATPDKDTTNQFTVKLTEEDTNATNMSTGQYFVVFQHPMYDGKFNIMVNDTTFYLNTSDNAVVGTTPQGSELFNVYDRQTANAAQALCDALDTQNIDDMYVKYSFFVVGDNAAFTISEIPSEVVKGDKIVISGVDTANAGETVVVEMISTAFAAVPKETVGSAAFILVTTEVADDGTWEVTLDTSDLNVDEYSLSVVIKDATKKNVKVNVVEGADKPDTPDTPDVPDTPDTPDTPTEPETPGFGALAALAGLGAVAVLLVRRE